MFALRIKQEKKMKCFKLFVLAGFVAITLTACSQNPYTPVPGTGGAVVTNPNGIVPGVNTGVYPNNGNFPTNTVNNPCAGQVNPCPGQVVANPCAGQVNPCPGQVAANPCQGQISPCQTANLNNLYTNAITLSANAAYARAAYLNSLYATMNVGGTCGTISYYPYNVNRCSCPTRTCDCARSYSVYSSSSYSRHRHVRYHSDDDYETTVRITHRHGRSSDDDDRYTRAYDDSRTTHSSDHIRTSGTPGSKDCGCPGCDCGHGHRQHTDPAPAPIGIWPAIQGVEDRSVLGIGKVPGSGDAQAIYDRLAISPVREFDSVEEGGESYYKRGVGYYCKKKVVTRRKPKRQDYRCGFDFAIADGTLQYPNPLGVSGTPELTADEPYEGPHFLVSGSGKHSKVITFDGAILGASDGLIILTDDADPKKARASAVGQLFAKLTKSLPDSDSPDGLIKGGTTKVGEYVVCYQDKTTFFIECVVQANVRTGELKKRTNAPASPKFLPITMDTGTGVDVSTGVGVSTGGAVNTSTGVDTGSGTDVSTGSQQIDDNQQ